MTDTPQTTETATTDPREAQLDEWAAGLTEDLGADGYTVEFDTVRILVDHAKWVDTIVAARERLPFFSWLSAIDWSKDVEVGEGVDDPDELEERFEVICRLSSVVTDDAAHFVATLPKANPSIGSLTPHIGGAEWHEREAHEMFGIDFEGNANLAALYLPDDFIGHPLLKSYPLISREVKPWPGEVDVEPMPAKDEDGDA